MQSLTLTHDSDSISQAAVHQRYLDSLVSPTLSQIKHINEVQLLKEQEIDRKYDTLEAHEAATTIQRAYRGHRERRHLDGLTLNPSERWSEAIREWRWRATIAAHSGLSSSSSTRSRAVSESAKLNWRRVGSIAEHIGAASGIAHAADSSAINGVALEADPSESLLMDTRYFLEMIDQKHRYGANLKQYHEEWQRSHADQNFFQWLDHGPGKTLDLPGCSQQKLDRERVRYLTREERKNYLVQVDGRGRLRWAKNDELITTNAALYQDSMDGIVPVGSPLERFDDKSVQERLLEEANFASQIAAIGEQQFNSFQHESPTGHHAQVYSDQPLQHDLPNAVDQHVANVTVTHHRHYVSPATILNHLLRATVKPGTWIYVADTLGRLYVGIKASGAFQHTSFLAGSRISSAGLIAIEDGKLTYLSPLSGHYRPTTKSFRQFIARLKEAQVDLTGLKTSKAYNILLGMEYYAQSKGAFHKLMHYHYKGKPHVKHSAIDSNKQPQTAVEPICAIHGPAAEHSTWHAAMNIFHHTKGTGT